MNCLSMKKETKTRDTLSAGSVCLFSFLLSLSCPSLSSSSSSRGWGECGCCLWALALLWTPLLPGRECWESGREGVSEGEGEGGKVREGGVENKRDMNTLSHLIMRFVPRCHGASPPCSCSGLPLPLTGLAGPQFSQVTLVEGGQELSPHLCCPPPHLQTPLQRRSGLLWAPVLGGG